MNDNKTDQKHLVLSGDRSLVVRSPGLAKRGLDLIQQITIVSEQLKEQVINKNYDIYNQGILVVNDEEHMRWFLKKDLQEAGFTNIRCASGMTEALNMLEGVQDEVVIIITHNVGVELGHREGREMVKVLAQEYNGIVGVVFFTPFDCYAEEAKSLGNDNVIVLDYIIANFNLTELIESLIKNIPLIMHKRETSEKDAARERDAL